MQNYTLEKFQQQISNLARSRYQQFKPIEDLELWHDDRYTAAYDPEHKTPDHRQLPPVNADWHTIPLSATWSGRDDYYWLRGTVSGSTEPTVVKLDLGRTGNGNNSGFEGLVYVEGKPRQAVDSNHTEVFLDPTSADRVHLTIALWTGLEGGGVPREQHYTIRQAAFGPLDPQRRQLYRYLVTIADLFTQLRQDDPLRYSYQELINRLINMGHPFDRLSEARAAKLLAKIHTFARQHVHEHPHFTVSVIGHTHIDVAWLWRYQHTREKAQRSFNTALQLMDEDPEFKFFFSSPQVYQFIQEDDPALFARVRKQIDAGRWEADGATWLEPDTTLNSGEALVRQFLYGMQFFRETLHTAPKVLWLPDVFGYSAALPQIMQGFGIQQFVTSKIAWNDTNRMPHDTFYWEGLDGSRVLTYFITTAEKDFDYASGQLLRYTYNGELTPKVLLTSYQEYQDKQLNDHLLLPFGFGDGGGGSTREMIADAHVMNELPGLPQVEFTRVDDFLAELTPRLQNRSIDVPVWKGELYLEYHRGTYTSQGWIKKQNRQLEFALRNLELLASSAWLERDIGYPRAQLTRLWQILLKNQFHDVLPGSAIHEVYQDAAADYQLLRQKIQLLTKERLSPSPVTNESATVLTLWNPNLQATREPIFVAMPHAAIFHDDDGRQLAAEHVQDGYLVKTSIPGLTALPLRVTPTTATTPSSVIPASTVFETALYRLSFNQAGQLSALYDKVHDRPVLSEPSNVLTVFADEPVDFDAWNIDHDYTNLATPLTADSITATQGVHALELQLHFTYGTSQITQKITVSDWTNRIDFATEVDWHEHQHLLSTTFRPEVQAASATYDVQFGNVQRSTSTNTSWESAQFEVTAQKWVDLSQSDYGVALLNDAKYGCMVKDNVMTLTLIKSGIYPDPEADQGHQAFTYSLLPHGGNALTGEVETAATELNNPVQVWTDQVVAPTPLITLLNDAHVELDAIKQAEQSEDLIVRLHEYSGGRQIVSLKPNFDFTEVVKSRLDEQPLTVLQPIDGVLTLALNPFEIVTLNFKKGTAQND